MRAIIVLGLRNYNKVDTSSVKDSDFGRKTGKNTHISTIIA